MGLYIYICHPVCIYIILQFALFTQHWVLGIILLQHIQVYTSPGFNIPLSSWHMTCSEFSLLTTGLLGTSCTSSMHPCWEICRGGVWRMALPLSGRGRRVAECCWRSLASPQSAHWSARHWVTLIISTFLGSRPPHRAQGHMVSQRWSSCPHPWALVPRSEFPACHRDAMRGHSGLKMIWHPGL